MTANNTNTANNLLDPASQIIPMLSNKEIQALQKRLDVLKIRLLIKQPFFGILLLQMRTVPNYQIKHVWTNIKELHYNPHYIQNLSDSQRISAMLHCVLHCALDHIERGTSKTKNIWELATDYSIAFLIKDNKYDLPTDHPYEEQYEGKSAEQIYELLKKEQEDQKSNSNDDDQENEEEDEDEEDEEENDENDDENEDEDNQDDESDENEDEDENEDDDEKGNNDGNLSDLPESFDSLPDLDDLKNYAEDNGENNNNPTNNEEQDGNNSKNGQDKQNNQDPTQEPKKNNQKPQIPQGPQNPQESQDPQDSENSQEPQSPYEDQNNQPNQKEEDKKEDGLNNTKRDNPQKNEENKDPNSNEAQSPTPKPNQPQKKANKNQTDNQQESKQQESKQQEPENKSGLGDLAPSMQNPTKNDVETFKGLVHDALISSNGQGLLPEELLRLIEQPPQSVIDWRTVLARYLTNYTKSNYSWFPPHYKYLSQGFYFPTNKVRSINLVIAIDTSGSIDQEMLEEFIGEILGIVSYYNDYNIKVINCDACIHEIYDFDTQNPISMDKLKNMHGGGGTDFRPVFEYCDNKLKDIDCLIYMTDAYGTFPSLAPKYPVIWLVNSDQSVPWGVRIKYTKVN